MLQLIIRQFRVLTLIFGLSSTMKRKHIFLDPFTSHKRIKEDHDEEEIFHIPQHLKAFITTEAPQYRKYQLRFTLESMDSIRRLAWGIEDTVEEIIVRMRFSRLSKNTFRARFCVHNSNDENVFGTSHHFYTSTYEDSNIAICTSRPNVLICVIGSMLHKVLKSGYEDLNLARLYQMVDFTIDSDPTTTCLICRENINVKVWTAAVCSEHCNKKLESWPLRAQLSNLIIDFKVLDFLLCCVYTAALPKIKYSTRTSYDSLFEGLHQITSIIDSLPKDLSEWQFPAPLSTAAYYDQECARLLAWLCSRFRGCMISLPPSANFHVPGLKKAHQFLLLNSHVERQEASEHKLSALSSKCGSLAFHGAPGFRIFDILSDGLKTNGGNLFYAPEPSISLNYARGLRASRRGVFFSPKSSARSLESPADAYLQPWKKSAFRGSQYLVLFGCEVSKSAISWRERGGKSFESWTSDESTVTIRYIFLCPPHETEASASTMKKTMVKTYKALNRGRLASGDIR